MTNRLSVLQKATRADVRAEPFPFLIIRNALPQEIYDELARTFPQSEQLGIDSSENNVRWNYSAHSVKTNSQLTPLWRDFIAYQASGDFFREIATLFQPEISKLYPDRFPSEQALTRLRPGVRKLDKFKSADILMDAQIAGNTAVTEASSVRSTHLDQGNKLFSGLFYMRPDGYDAVGGNLTISRFAPQLRGKPERFDLIQNTYVDDKYVEHVETIPYDANVLVLFINCLDALHGVTVRQPTEKSRLFVNLIGQVSPPLYNLEGKPGYLPAADVERQSGFFGSVQRLFRRAG